MSKRSIPVSKPIFKRLDIGEIDDSPTPISSTLSNYRGESSDGVVFSVQAETETKLVYRLDFFCLSGGEFLLESLSPPLGSTFDWSRNPKIINFLEPYTVGLFEPKALKGLFLDSSKPLTAGSVLCLGSKEPLDSSFKRNVMPSLYDSNSFGPFDDYTFLIVLNTYAGVGQAGLLLCSLVLAGSSSDLTTGTKREGRSPLSVAKFHSICNPV